MITTQVFENREEWLEARKGIFTASEIHRLLAGKPEELSKGAMTYILEVLAESVAAVPEPYYNSEMQWGQDNEYLAVEALLNKLGIELSDPDNIVIYTSIGGFVFFKLKEIAGGTPDLIMPGYCVEIKCPDPDTHLYYRLFLTAENFKKELPMYYAQMQFNMYLTQKDWCLFVSFDPRFNEKENQLFVMEIQADKEYQNLILGKLALAEAKLTELKSQLA